MSKYDKDEFRDRRGTRTLSKETEYGGAGTDVWEGSIGHDSLLKRGQNTPNFKQLRKQGSFIPPQPLTFRSEVYRRVTGTKSNRLYGYGTVSRPRILRYGEVLQGWLDETVPDYLTLSSFRLSQLDEKAIQSLRSKIKDTSVNLGQTIGEGSQTVAMFKDSAERYLDFATRLKRGNFRGALGVIGIKPSRGSRSRFRKAFGKSPPAAIASAHLEYAFGWVPLIEDVQGIAYHVAKTMLQDRPLTATASGLDRESHRSMSHDDDTGASYTVNLSTEVSIKYGVSFGITSGVTDQITQLGLSNPLGLAWEVLPMSFVLNWFVNIGGVLDGLDATTGKYLQSGYKITKRTSAAYITINWDKYREMGWNHSGAGGGFRRLVEVHREVLTEFPSSYLPIIRNPFSNLIKIALGVSLGAQKIFNK